VVTTCYLGEKKEIECTLGVSLVKFILVYCRNHMSVRSTGFQCMSCDFRSAISVICFVFSWYVGVNKLNMPAYNLSFLVVCQRIVRL